MPPNKRFSARVLQAYEAGPVADKAGLVQVRAAAGDQPAELLIYDAIGSSFWEDGVTAKAVIAALATAGAGPVRVRINSPGGDVFEGMAIYNALLAHTGGVETVVDGLAASAASIIALAGSTMTMQATSMLMIHNSATIAFGNRHDMTAVADVMGKIDGQLAAIYAAKSGTPLADCAAAMDAETWFTATEAAAAGYADTVLPAAPAKAAPDAAVVAAEAARAITAAVEISASETDRRRRRLRSAEAQSH